MRQVFFIGLLAILPGATQAHPHIFIDTALRLIMSDEGTLEAVEVEWAYDELYTLLLLQEMRLDLDLDGKLTEAEQDHVSGFDLKWPEGHQGDLFVSRNGVALDLGPPTPVSTRLEDDRIISIHRRAVTSEADNIVVQAYDPSFYTAYTLSGGVEVSGSCDAEILPANLNHAYAALEELLFATPQSQIEENFPAVGESFADKVTIKC